MFKLSKTVTLRFNINLRRMLILIQELMYILFYFWHTEALKKKLLQLLLQFSLSKRDNSHTIEKKVTSFLTIFLDISLSTSNVSGNVVLASLGFSVGISSPKWSFLQLTSLFERNVRCQQNMPLTWYCKIYFWQFSVMSQWHA